METIDRKKIHLNKKTHYTKLTVDSVEYNEDKEKYTIVATLSQD